jgi:amidase
MPDILSLDATGQLAALEARRISAVELLEEAARRYKTQHARINAVVAHDFERAGARARAIDEARSRGENLPMLAGLPMTIKDTFEVEHLPASSGLRALLGRGVADAVVVARARLAGAVIWGKTNVPVMAGDWQSYNSLYGTTNNPWDVTRTPGGSSGGAAAAVASGITALEIGSDIGGSLRVPAAFSGIYSHKPTWGLVSQRGHVPPAPGSFAQRDLNVVGPMARSARDLRLLLSVMEDGPLAAKAPPANLRGLKIGLWTEDAACPLDPQVLAVVQAFAASLAAQGAEVKPTQPVQGAELMPAYLVLLGAIVAQDMDERTRRQLRLARAFGDLAGAIGLPAPWMEAIGGYAATHLDWMAADETRARIGAELRGLWDRFDVVLAPVSAVTAFPHDHTPFLKRKLTLSDGAAIPYRSMLNWIALATACGLPVTTIPAGLAADGLPVGLQIIGPRGADARTLAVAQGIEEALGGFVAPPAE